MYYSYIVSSDRASYYYLHVKKLRISDLRYDFKMLLLWKTKWAFKYFKVLQARIEIKHLNTILTKSLLPSDHKWRNGYVNLKLGLHTFRFASMFRRTAERPGTSECHKFGDGGVNVLLRFWIPYWRIYRPACSVRECMFVNDRDLRRR